jgi:ABC-type uncharacterized transport system permease subunit
MSSVPAPLLVPSLAALLSYGTAALLGARAGSTLRIALIVGWVAHALALLIDMTGLGTDTPGARFGFAPALSMTSWLVLAVYVVESRFVPLDQVRRTMAVLGLLAVALALFFPGELLPHASTRWAPLHWVLGIASYGLFGAAVLHALLLDSADRRMRSRRPGEAVATPMGLPLLRLERLTFAFVAVGFAALSATLLLGVAFASPWRWDHKTVFSLLAWVVFAALLAGRQAFGWRGRQATRWVYVGAALLLLAYVGSRFVLEVMLGRA